MLIRDIVKLTNTYLAGEQLVYQKLIPFYDAVIDDINDRLSATYPAFSSLDLAEMDSDTAQYSFFPDKYIRTVVALGAAHKFYMMDEEGQTYDTAYEAAYERNLFFMMRDHIDHVPKIYQSDTTGGVLIDEDSMVDYDLPICPRLLRGL